MSISSAAEEPGYDSDGVNKSSKIIQMNEDSSVLLDESKTKMVVPKRKLSKVVKLGLIICVLTVVFIIISALATGRRISNIFSAPASASVKVQDRPTTDNFAVDKHLKTFSFKDSNSKKQYLTVDFPHKIKEVKYNSLTPCRDTYSKGETYGSDSEQRSTLQSAPQTCLSFDNDIYAAVYDVSIGPIDSHYVQWYSSRTDDESEITNCINIETDDSDRWYGGGGLSVQRWPLNRVDVPLQPYLTQKFNPLTPPTREAEYDSFIEPYFISADGTVVILDAYLPVFISINHQGTKKLCFTSAFRKPYSAHSSKDLLLLKYTVYKGRTAKSIHNYLLEYKKIHHPLTSPSVDILRTPIWSTRGIDSNDVNETEVVQFVNDIKKNKLPHSYLYIDGNYSRSSGIFFFNEKKFPHSHQMIMEFDVIDQSSAKLHVGTEVFPYVPNSSDLSHYGIKYKDKEQQGFQTKLPLHLDVTNTEAVKWYKSHLTDISKQISVKGFRFSGGHAQTVLAGADESVLITNKTLHHPNEFTQKYGEIAGEFKGLSLLGSGYQSQYHGLIADAGPLVSTWKHNKGLKSIIPTVLTYGIMGYPFVLAGPVGGINIEDTGKSLRFHPPPKELYIRWLQLAIYLPVMELSVRPWLYGEDVLNYTQYLLEFRNNVLWPKYFSSAVAEASGVGTPIARPLWWIAPDDPTARYIDCEFILGNSLLVAPVLNSHGNDNGPRGRDIYLPDAGWWKNQLDGKYYKGGQWLRWFKVDLFQIATFVNEAPPKGADH